MGVVIAMLGLLQSVNTPAFFIPGFGLPELVIILVIILVIFGPKKLPEMGKAIGQSVRDLRKATEQKEEPQEEELP